MGLLETAFAAGQKNLLAGILPMQFQDAGYAIEIATRGRGDVFQAVPDDAQQVSPEGVAREKIVELISCIWDKKRT